MGAFTTAVILLARSGQSCVTPSPFHCQKEKYGGKNAINKFKLQKTVIEYEFLIEFFHLFIIKTCYIKLLFLPITFAIASFLPTANSTG